MLKFRGVRTEGVLARRTQRSGEFIGRHIGATGAMIVVVNRVIAFDNRAQSLAIIAIRYTGGFSHSVTFAIQTDDPTIAVSDQSHRKKQEQRPGSICAYMRHHTNVKYMNNCLDCQLHTDFNPLRAVRFHKFDTLNEGIQKGLTIEVDACLRVIRQIRGFPENSDNYMWRQS